MAVHQLGQVGGRVAHLAEGLQVPGGFPPPSAPVGGEAGQFLDGGDAGGFGDDLFDLAERILEPAPLVGAEGCLGLLDEPLSVRCGGDVGGVADFGSDLGWEGRAARECGEGSGRRGAGGGWGWLGSWARRLRCRGARSGWCWCWCWCGGAAGPSLFGRGVGPLVPSVVTAPVDLPAVRRRVCGSAPSGAGGLRRRRHAGG